MSKINIIKQGDNYYLEVSNDFTQFLSIKIKLTKGEVEELQSMVITVLEE